jgi:flagellar motor switch protein FliN/FliY
MADTTEEKTTAQPEQNAANSNASNDATKAKLDELKDDATKITEESPHPNMDVILEIPVSISMEVGRTNISIRNLLKLSQGSVVELDRFAGDPLDVFINGTLIAHGEVVVVNEKFGIRLTDVISQTERIKKLGEQDAI